MKEFGFTDYFENEVLRKRPYLQKAWCVEVVMNPLHVEEQIDDGRVRYWGKIEEAGGRFLRVVTLADRATVHNAFFDRRFKP